MNDRVLEGKSGRDVNLNDNQGITMKDGMPLKVVEGTEEKGGCSETSV